MRVSVLIPTYNRAHLISDAIQSVRAQTFSDYEIVVVDDGSTDGTEELLASMPDVRYVRCAHAGVAAARNRALAEAKGELVAFLDSDDLWAPEKLERQVAYLDAHPECWLVFSEYENFTDDAIDELSPAARRLLSEKVPCYMASALIRAELFDRTGGFSESIALGEDTEWIMKVRALGIDTSATIPEVLYRRRVHEDNTVLLQGSKRLQASGAALATGIRGLRKLKKEKKRVSVLIPTYNRAHLISEAIGSVRAQTFRDYEIVVVDDGSTDGTEELLASMPDVRCVRCAHAGVAAARNRALAEARGELVAFLDSDDLWAPEKLERQVAYLDAHPECDIVFSAYRSFTELPEEEHSDVVKALLEEIVDPCLATALVRRSLFDTHGSYQEGMECGEDTEWLMRIKTIGVDLTHKLDDVLYLRRVHTSNLTYIQGMRTKSDHGAILAAGLRNAWKRSRKPARVSVLIPTYNRAHLISEAIGSVRAQTFSDYEIVVVDDGSTDGTEELLASMPDVRCVCCAHAGVAAARNRALAEARGELVAFLDSDDLWAPEKLERQVAYLDAHPECNIVFCASEQFLEAGIDEPSAKQRELLDDTYSMLLPSALIRRALFDRYGTFNEKFRYAEDTEWLTRIKLFGEDISASLPDVLYRYRIHDGNTMLKAKQSGGDRLKAIAIAARTKAAAAKEQARHVVSVIIPAYNAERYLAEAVASAQGQVLPPEISRLEVIVVDDGSTDGTRALAESIEGVVVVPVEHGGTAVARNAGLARATGDIILFLDADDVFVSGAVNRLAGTLARHDELDAVFSLLKDFISPELTEEQREGLPCREKPYAGAFAGATCIRRSAFDTFGTFDESLSAGEGVDWVLRFRNGGGNGAGVREITTMRRIHLTNMGRSAASDEKKNYAKILRERGRRA